MVLLFLGLWGGGTAWHEVGGEAEESISPWGLGNHRGGEVHRVPIQGSDDPFPSIKAPLWMHHHFSVVLQAGDWPFNRLGI